MAAWKLGPALACGNTVVLKAAEQTPLSILYLAPLIKEAGFPAGVVNILNGEGRTAGAAIASHTGIDKIAFTGSTATGREIMKMAAINLKDITLETGGKSPLLIFEDADLDQAIKWSHYGIMSNMGQICTATSRIFVHEGIFDRFLDRFKQHIKSVSKLGDPFDEDTFQGPQVSKAQYERVRAYIESGVSEGAAVAFGGLDGAAAKESSAAEEEEDEGQTSGKGYFIPPTVFTNVTDSMKIYREEIFGPVAVVSSFGDEDDVIRRANDTIYGLSSAVFTRDLARAHRVARKLESGTVWINSSQDGDIRVPFGGVKQSGIGRELGEAALAAYTSVKAVHVNLENDL
ncbi:MAG: mitochondrial aldehyde dehydrogenase [Lichina confinis]|nr:MAG: mitochondrial aldehyde dehydrogenase [Lichina confinis]